ncbi:uncharacterized protein [Palaemon carinicauda]|uniref:uncharacterized protein n=1 Tax=Palaemon carinicauda TaxID=392227 RepID=UPI0035B67A30
MALPLTLGTLGAGSFVALAGGTAIAGAIGLGIAGLAVLLSRQKDYRKKQQKKERYQQNSANQQDSYYRRTSRGKRAAKSSAVNNLLQVIREEDVTGCGLKLVCELAGTTEEELGTEERAILDLIGPIVPPGEGLLPSGGARDYMLAKAFGQQYGNCTQAFPNCHLQGTDIMANVMNFLP